MMTKSWARLVTQCPTCQTATLYTHWCRMRKGLINCSYLSGRPLPIQKFRPAKLVTWQPVIPNGRNPLALPNGVNPLHCPGQIATPQRCVLGRSLGTQIGLGWSRQNDGR
jgi:hypothetical protein